MQLNGLLYCDLQAWYVPCMYGFGANLKKKKEILHILILLLIVLCCRYPSENKHCLPP